MWSPKICKYVFSLSEELLSPLVRLQSCSLGQKRRRVPVKQVLRPWYQQFVREILGNSRQEVVDHGHVTLALLHLLLSVQHDLRNKRRENRFNTSGCDFTWRACTPASTTLYRGGEVDGHQRVRREEKVVKSQGVLEVWEHVAKPCDEPRQCKDGPHLSSDRKGTRVACQTKNIHFFLGNVKTVFSADVLKMRLVH